MIDHAMKNIRQRANARFAAQVRAQNEQEQRRRVAHQAAEAERMKGVRAVQWRTRFNAVERKLIEVRNYLRYNPSDEALRAECAALEQMYRALLDEQAA